MVALATILLVAGGCEAAQAAQARLVRIQVSPASQVTHVHIDLSSPSPFHVSVRSNPDRVELDFPGASWSDAVQASGVGQGFVTVYRKASSPDGGAMIVFETTSPVRILSAGSGLAAPGQPVGFDLDIASTDGSPPPQPTMIQPMAAAAVPHVLAVPSRKAPAPVETSEALPVSLFTDARAAENRPTVPPSSVMLHKARRIIAIDPGHGGIDPGTASSDGIFEKAITLETGLALKSALEATGHYTVVMTRSDDTFIPLQDRVQLARRAGAELFVSLHCDAMEGRDARGATVYTLSQNASDSVAERLAANENKSAEIGGIKLASEDDGTANLLINLSMSDSMNQSNRFAELIVGEFGEHHIRLQDLKPHRSAGFAVLKAADMPSVLIEMGYLSDADDAALLGDPRHQREISEAITAGIDKYFGVADGRKS
jgi:N-acetylmuramoyl-L-alanine amidase